MSGGDVVLGAAIGHRFDQVKPFLASLRNAGYSGRVVLLVDRSLERRLRDDPLVGNVTLLRARQWLPFKLRLVRRRRFMRWVWTPVSTGLWIAARSLAALPVAAETRLRWRVAIATLVCTPMEARFLHYRRFLERDPPGRVLLSDVRDVVFQDDPFSTLPGAGLAVSIESWRYTVASEPHNAAWVKRVYGPSKLQEIGERRVSCVGVTYGDGATVANYVRLMSAEILRLSPSRLGVGGADTAIHNALVWTGRLGRVRELETLTSPVATLNGFGLDDVRVSAEGKLLNLDGSCPSVVHQYDRVPDLAPRLLRALAG